MLCEKTSKTQWVNVKKMSLEIMSQTQWGNVKDFSLEISGSRPHKLSEEMLRISLSWKMDHEITTLTLSERCGNTTIMHQILC